MYVRKRGNKTSFSLQVIGIEVTRPIWKLDDYGVYETYYRTIRFKLHGGKVLEVHCSGAVEEYLKLRSVKTLKKLKTIEKRKPWNSGTPANGDWLTPVVYQGRSPEVTNPEPEDPGPPPLYIGIIPVPSLMEKMVSGVRTAHSRILGYVENAKRLFR
jgi:hypothetical protein